MDLKDLYLISDLILQKLDSFQSDSEYGNLERTLLIPYVKQLSSLQNAGLIQSYANEVFGSISKAVICKTLYELNKKEPNLDKLRSTLEIIEEFMKETIGMSVAEMDEMASISNEGIKGTLETLKSEIKNWIKKMPHVAMADKVPDDITEELNKLKEKYMELEKENLKWSK